VIIFVNFFYCFTEECASLPANSCNTYEPTTDDGTKRCVLYNGKCELKECNELYNCEDFPTIGEGDDMQKCVSNGGCELKKCSELELGRCELFGFDKRGK
jgi:hypothetical protein